MSKNTRGSSGKQTRGSDATSICPTTPEVPSGEDIKYILVTGGVISGIGKGIISSSLGTLLKACGLCVTSIKIDPYINIDAGTFSPYEHGEVFVLDDGGEVDLDLGNYERYLDITLTRDNNITTGKIYQSVIEKERRGDYLGKTVQVVPHITDAIQEWVQRVARISVDESGQTPQVAIVELGGVIGDIESMPFVEAFRQFQFTVGKGNFCCIHVSLVPSPNTTGEHKTKPTQMSVRTLRGAGLSPDVLMCRCTSPMTKEAVEKLSMFCHVAPDHVVCVEDVSCLYRVPLLLMKQRVHETLLRHFNMPGPMVKPRLALLKWQQLVDRSEQCSTVVRIALVGKYVKLSDSYASVYKALSHAALHCNLRLHVEPICSEELEEETLRSDPAVYHEAWKHLCTSDGVLVPGGFGMRGSEGKIAAIKWCREQCKPLLGICFGMQLTVVEFARNVLHWSDAHSTELDPHTKHPVVIEMPEHHPGNMGGTMRLGSRVTYFQPAHKEHSILHRLYRQPDKVHERHRHRYEVNPKLVDEMERAGLHFVGKDESGQRMEQLEVSRHPFLVGVQYHPEYLSRPTKPSPPYLGLILAASGRLAAYLKNRCSVAKRTHSFLEDSDEEGISAQSTQDVHSLVREMDARLRKKDEEEASLKMKNGDTNHLTAAVMQDEMRMCKNVNSMPNMAQTEAVNGCGDVVFSNEY